MSEQYPGFGPAPQKPENPFLKIGILVILLLVLSALLIHFNIVSCGFYSQVGCEVYYGIIAGGKPRVLIVHANSGMGDPQLLFDTLKSARIGARVSTRELESTTLPLLQQNQLVIVEKAQKMSLQDIKMFQDYASRGGRLIWTGDAGTKKNDNESDQNYFLKFSDRKVGGSEEFIGPWARRSGDNQVSFDYLLGVQFVGNYCTIKACDKSEITGYFDFPNQSDKLSNGLTQGLPFYGDFSLVKLNDSGTQKVIAFIDYRANFISDKNNAAGDYFWLSKESQNFGRNFPAIVSSGLGGRVAYYSFPPEYFVSEQMPVDKTTEEKIAYWGLIENMYFGMLYK